MNSILSYSNRKLKKYKKVVKKINNIDFSQLEYKDFEKKTILYRSMLKEGASLNKLLPEAFALVKEASKRALEKTHYDVQLMGGIALNEGNVGEMRTGEGKTLVSTLPAYLNALTGIPVHIVTVNEYLAKRDYQELLPLYTMLGITCGFISSEMTYWEKKVAYQSDIVYGTNNEFGFDYLRDNMVTKLEHKVQRELGYAIIDEVDSILIDESRTPLVISGPSTEKSNILESTNTLVLSMNNNVDYEIDLETQQVFLTEKGIQKAEEFFQIDNLYSPDKVRILHFINQSLKANYILKKDKDYIVTNGEINIIDEFTGRVSTGRRFSNNLHQAIEVKEKVDMKEETATKATITYQNYFRLYKKLAGMTGTAETEKEELKQVYKMNTLVIPTNKQINRIDNNDLIFFNKEEKLKAIVQKATELYNIKQPVLIGTATIEESEEISDLFSIAQIPHVVLNAKNHEKEAEIIAKAGEKGSVTIATNMAGRGTDIKLGSGVVELGGLFVIGTAKNENRRVDNQLKGRSGRQGDLGETQFYISLEDEIMLRFGGNKAKDLMVKLNLNEPNGISSPILTKVFNNAQKQLEGANYDARKRLLKYDDILSMQRNLVYRERENILILDVLDEQVKKIITYSINNLLKESIYNEDEIEANSSIDKVSKLTNIPKSSFAEVTGNDNSEEVIDYVNKITQQKLFEKLEVLPEEIKNNLIRDILLNSLDRLWEQHLEQLNDIRQGIHLYSYSQTDPFREYQIRAKEAFDSMMHQFHYDTAQILFSLVIEKSNEIRE